MKSGVSKEGIRYAVRQSGRSVAYCALTIGCGTRYEGRYPAGIAHFVEHTLFRGTSRKSAAVITGYLDRLGGELNAYTTKEEIVLHATVLKEDLGKAARLLFELATEATFARDASELCPGAVRPGENGLYGGCRYRRSQTGKTRTKAAYGSGKQVFFRVASRPCTGKCSRKPALRRRTLPEGH